ncbi:ABC transporter substrate-binding protein, partial [Phytoactinopolyspora endophytica]|uniref:ABC transporter substrate-binding protein n=1 Tax=Phytoactinopolyspora endophytica TaxID=1642495 RepID=UPI0013EADDAD
NPDIRIEFSNSPPVEEYISTLQTRLLSGQAADVFIIAAENKTNLIEGEHVVDLTDYEFMSVINDFNKETYSADGSVYGMSVSSWAGGVLYNTELVESVGMSEPPASWQEFLELCRSLEEAGITAYYESVQSGNTMALTGLIGLDQTKAGGDVDQRIFAGESTFAENWVEPLELYMQLYDDGLVTRDVVGLDDEQVVDEFVNGRVAMIGTGPWTLPSVHDQSPDMQVDFMAVPGATAGE